MNLFIEENKKTDLCLFFCGWGTDEKLYLHLLKDYDYILFYDYSDINNDFNFDFSKYRKIYLLAYSAGVAMPAILKDRLPKTDLSIAINGCLRLFDDKAINKEALTASETVNSSNYIDFRRQYLVASDKELELFCENAPLRTSESCYNELLALQELSKQYPDLHYNYDIIFTAKDDKFILSDIVREEFKRYKVIEGGHFPFFRYDSFKYFIDEAAKAVNINV